MTSRHSPVIARAFVHPQTPLDCSFPNCLYYTHINSHTSTSSKTMTTTKAPKFLRTLYTILHSEPQDILAWSRCGAYFQVFDIHRLETLVLPQYFKHNKFASFQRQLNNFGFRKWTKTRASVCTFSHDSLGQCHPSELAQLVEECGVVSPHTKDVKETGKRSRSDSSSSSYSTASETQSEASDEEDGPETSKRVKADDVDDCIFLSELTSLLQDTTAATFGELVDDDLLDTFSLEPLDVACGEAATIEEADAWISRLVNVSPCELSLVAEEDTDIEAFVHENWSDLLDSLA